MQYLEHSLTHKQSLLGKKRKQKEKKIEKVKKRSKKHKNIDTII